MSQPRAFVLLTALPPTKGHLKLIEYASWLAPTEVIVCTQPDEPWHYERALALASAISKIQHNAYSIHYNRIHKEIPQEPDDEPGFWDMWAEFLYTFGFEAGDYIVASEHYGKTLAERVNGVFMPYDIDRQLYPGKATAVRNNLFENFAQVLPEFQPYLRKTITVFGAESTGKTTLSRSLAQTLNGQWLFEYARPYLENTINEVTPTSMEAIWKGQLALQSQGRVSTLDKPFVIQDTDLFSTVGYWNYSPWAGLKGTKCPDKLLRDAQDNKSDLYIVLQSDIPFERDSLRYGGDKREIPDEKWIELLEAEKLPYAVMHRRSGFSRLSYASIICRDLFEQQNADLTNYRRRGSEYVNAYRV